ncbi:Signal recognition particle receptor subunit alpha [Martiniozyma asiatica (nom. inval.)]|nr:Signal recognition particle receptor subunit alpha [Martiniozyma asiatica]
MSAVSQFLIFEPSGLVNFNYQPDKGSLSTVNSFIQNVLVHDRGIINQSQQITDAKAADEKDKGDAIVLQKKEPALDSADEVGKGSISGQPEDVADSDNDKEDDDDEDEDDEDEKDAELPAVDTDISLGTYVYKSTVLKYLIWVQGKSKLYFIMTYPKLLTIKKPYDFLKQVKILYQGCQNAQDMDKFNKFFSIKIEELNSQAFTKEVKVAPTAEPLAYIVNDSKKSKKLSQQQSNGKKSRKWNDDGTFYEENENVETNLDFSNEEKKSNMADIGSANLSQLLGNQNEYGSKTSKGQFIISDLSDEMNKMLITTQKKSSANSTANSSASNGVLGSLKSYVGNFVGGKKITKDDLNKLKSTMVQHLIKKNVSPNVANELMNEVEKELVGTTTSSFTSIEESVRQSLSAQLVKLLTPNTSVNLLHEIQSKVSSGKGPYAISVVGVNGVGKSTNLSKLAYWLLQNDYRVLVAACDTFRSGAVEQLRTHVTNLKKLSNHANQIDLFESGYGGADLVAKIATGAIAHAKKNNYDIVLMDTAGRRHNDLKLMAPLASFAKAANPDKIIMVGEALVGTDSVMQAQNFNKAFGKGRTLDCFIISKCDTVGEMVGSMVNMVYATGIPILFVGTGQTYTDLRTLSVDWAVEMLIK